MGKIKPGRDKTKVDDHIVRIITHLKTLLLKIEEGYCMGTDNNKCPDIKGFGTKHLIPLDIWGTALIINSKSTYTPDKDILLENIYSLMA